MALTPDMMGKVLGMDYDDLKQLNTFVVATIKQQRAERNQRAAIIAQATIHAGDTVVLNGLRPQSLNGTIAIVDSIQRTRATIKHPTRGLVTVPLSCITIVTESDEDAGSMKELHDERGY